MKKKLALIISIISSLAFYKPALAVCPICTIAVGSGLGLSRWLGIDDIITGLWIGGLTVSMIFWTISKIENKENTFKGYKFLVTAGYYLLIASILFLMGPITSPTDTINIFGLDKIVIGIIIGSVGFWFGAEWYFDIKEKNDGHAQFPFQKVVMPLLPLIVISIIFHLLIKF